MKALLLAAGLGTRLRPLTDRIPKCLVPLADRPLLDYWLEQTQAHGIPSLVNLHYFPEQVRDFLARSEHGALATTVYEPRLLGTAGTLKANLNYFANSPTLFVHADNFSRFSLKDFISRHRSRPPGCAITMMTFETDQPQSCGILEIDGQGVVQAMHEKVPNPPGRVANAAVYILEPEVLEFVKNLPGSEAEFSRDVIPAFLGRIYTFANETYHRDIGSPESYAKAQADLAKNPALKRVL